MEIIIFLLFFISVYLVAAQFYGRKEVSPLLTLEEGAEGQIQPEVRKASALHGILKFFVPITTKIIKKIRLEGLASRLVMAGSPLNVPEFIALEILSTALVPTLAVIFMKLDFMGLGIALGAGFLLPVMWLGNKIRRRHYLIARDLPNVIDLLNLCVSAGMDFMLAVSRVTRDFKRCPLTEELHEVLRENQMGLARRDALKNMGKRINLAEVSSFVRTLVQADRMGSPLSEALNIQAEEIRIRRFQRGETQALKAPIKMLIPLVLFILPIILIIVGGPIMLQFMNKGGISF